MINFNQLKLKILRKIYSPEKWANYIGVNIGKGNFIPDKYTWSSEPYLITVGNNCQITMGVRIFTHGGNHVIRTKCPNFDSYGKVTIGDNVYIGNNSLVMPGVTIGSNVLIAAGSVVTKSIPDGTVVAGNPARFICNLDEYALNNEKYNLCSKGFSSKQKRQLLLSTDDSKFIQKRFLETN